MSYSVAHKCYILDTYSFIDFGFRWQLCRMKQFPGQLKTYAVLLFTEQTREKF